MCLCKHVIHCLSSATINHFKMCMLLACKACASTSIHTPHAHTIHGRWLLNVQWSLCPPVTNVHLKQTSCRWFMSGRLLHCDKHILHGKHATAQICYRCRQHLSCCKLITNPIKLTHHYLLVGKPSLPSTHRLCAEKSILPTYANNFGYFCWLKVIFWKKKISNLNQQLVFTRRCRWFY